jgi:hypothetical protein
VWTLHTYVHEAAAISPLLCVGSPEKRCGKHRTLEILACLVDRPVPTANLPSATPEQISAELLQGGFVLAGSHDFLQRQLSHFPCTLIRNRKIAAAWRDSAVLLQGRSPAVFIA